MRRFLLARIEDPSGVSGTGFVAEGVEFGDGIVVMRWLTGTASTAVYDHIADVVTIHGHGGATRVRWIDPPLTPVESPQDFMEAYGNPRLSTPPVGVKKGAHRA